MLVKIRIVSPELTSCGKSSQIVDKDILVANCGHNVAHNQILPALGYFHPSNAMVSSRAVQANREPMV